MIGTTVEYDTAGGNNFPPFSLPYIADMNVRNLLVCTVLIWWLSVGVSAQWKKGLGFSDSTSIIASVKRGHNGLLIACSKGEGVFISTDDGVSWTSRSTGLPTEGTAYVDINAAEVHEGNVYVGTVRHGIWRYDDAAGEWRRLSGADSTSILSMTVHNGIVYAGCFQFGLLRVTNDNHVQTEYYPILGDGLTITELVSAQGKLYVGTDQDGWNVYNPETGVLSADNRGFLTERPYSVWPRAVATNGSSVTAVLGMNLQGGGVYARSSDADEWVKYEDGLPLVFQTIYGAAAVGSTYFVSTGYFGGQGIYTRTYGDPAWMPWNDGLVSLDIEDVVAWHRSTDTVRVVVSSRRIGMWYRDTIVPTTSVVHAFTQSGHSRQALIVHRNDVPALLEREGLCSLYDVTGRSYRPESVGMGWHVAECPHRARIIMLIVP